MGFHISRIVLYSILFGFSVILMGISCYRVNYTEKLKDGDILTSRHHFYDPVIVELIVTSILSIVWSAWLLSILLFRLRRGLLVNYGAEMLGLLVLWIMFIIGTSITTHKWSNLKWCRSHHYVCRILESIKAFGWMCWALVSALILASLWNMKINNHDFTGPAHGRREYEATSYPQTRQAVPATTTSAAQPVAASSYPANASYPQTREAAPISTAHPIAAYPATGQQQAPAPV